MRPLVQPVTVGLCVATFLALVGFLRGLFRTVRQASGIERRQFYRVVMLPRLWDVVFVGLASLSLMALNPYGPLWTARTSDIPFVALVWLVLAWPFVLGVILTRLGAALLSRVSSPNSPESSSESSAAMDASVISSDDTFHDSSMRGGLP